MFESFIDFLFSDYVYNPKEARIRKAMREASRERALGVTTMASVRGGRRSQPWSMNEEESPLMMVRFKLTFRSMPRIYLNS